MGRAPTVVERCAFDAQWSEHCSYKSSRVHLARLPTEGPDVILGPGEDAGIVRLGEWEGESYGIVVAHESHNHPSQVVPFEGAATGVGGIVRDVLCMGARVIALADPLRFGPLDDPHSRYVAQGVVDGIAAYGNAIGVPTIAGDVAFHEGFRDNCLVNVIALGIVKESEIIHSRAPERSAGWDIVLIGKATDRSGFGGAAFSSLSLDAADAEANKGAVQVPDPFLKNVIMRASYRAFDVIRELGLTVGFKDLGAGGIMGCTAELVASGGFGARIDLDRCPTAEPDLPPEVISVGETQERLAWVVPPSFTPRLLAIYNEEFSLPEVARGAQAAVIGTVTTERDYVLTHRGAEVMCVPIDFLTGGVKYERAYELPPDCQRPRVFKATRAAEHVGFFERVLAHPDVASRRPIYERYDSVVRGATSHPAGYADAGVVVPIPGAPLAVALGLGGTPRYARLDPKRAAEFAVCEAIRNVVAVGARPAALTDCLNFGNPEDSKAMGEFVAAVEGIALAAREFGLPFVTGNVSFYNQSTTGSAIPSSPVIGCVGVLEDVARAVTPRLKRVGWPLYYIGQRQEVFGGSVYAEILDLPERPLPNADYQTARAVQALLLEAIRLGLISAAHDVSDGGTLTAVAEMCLWSRGHGDFGAHLDEPHGDVDLFGEAGGFVVEVNDAPRFDALAANRYVLPVRLGTTSDDGDISFGGRQRHGENGAPFASISLAEMYQAWSAPLHDFYEGATA